MSQSPGQSAQETTVRLTVMTLAVAPILNMSWLQWIQNFVDTSGYWGALLTGIPYVFIAWFWGYWLRRFYSNRPKYINRPRGFY